MCPRATWDSGCPARARPSQEVLSQVEVRSCRLLLIGCVTLGRTLPPSLHFPSVKWVVIISNAAMGVEHSAVRRAGVLKTRWPGQAWPGDEELTPGASELSAGMQFPLEALAQVRHRNASEWWSLVLEGWAVGGPDPRVVRVTLFTVSGLSAVNFKLVILRSSKGSPRYARASP